MDNWKLKELFKFTNGFSKVHNDTDEIQVHITPNGNKREIKPNQVLDVRQRTTNYEITNNNKLILSNNTIEESDFDEDFHEIILKYNEISEKEKIIGLKKFLNFHFDNTKHKKLFVDFIKYYIKPKLWISVEKRKNFCGYNVLILLKNGTTAFTSPHCIRTF